MMEQRGDGAAVFFVVVVVLFGPAGFVLKGAASTGGLRSASG